MVSDEFKKMIKEETTYKIERRIAHLRAEINKNKRRMKPTSKHDKEEASALCKEYKEKLFYCVRILKLRRLKENKEQNNALEK